MNKTEKKELSKLLAENKALKLLLGCYEFKNEDAFRKEYFKEEGAIEYRGIFELYFVTADEINGIFNDMTDEYHKLKDNIILNIKYSFELYGGDIDDIYSETIFNLIVNTIKQTKTNVKKIKMEPETNTFYRYIIDKYRGVYNTKMINDMIDLFSFINLKTSYSVFPYRNKSKIFITEEIEVDESFISNEHKQIISNFDYDSYNKTCVIDNYTPCGLIPYAIEYYIKRGYTVVTKFGSSLPFSIDDNENTIEKKYNVDANGNPASEKVIYISNNFFESKYLNKMSVAKTRIKNLIFLNCNDIRYSELKKEIVFRKHELEKATYNTIFNFKKIMLNTNKHIFTTFFINLLVGFTKFSDYTDEVKQLCDEYVDMKNKNSSYGKLRIDIVNDCDSIISKMSKEYDDSKSGIITKFMHLYKTYMGSDLDYTPFAMCLYGAPGTGKSYFANKLADVIFQGEKSLFSISFNSAGSIEMFSSELFGSAKGYLGSNKKTEFQKFIEENIDDGGVILLDEVDKAKSEEAIDMFLTILSSGKVSFNGEHAAEHSINKFIFVFCGNYNTNRTSNIYTINNMSRAFKSRMRFIEQVYPSSDKEKMISSIFYKEVSDKIRRYGINKEISITIDKSISKLSMFSGNEINGRAYRNLILSKFSLVISNMIDTIIKDKLTKFKLAIDSDSKSIIIDAK